jgi:hypothetical protein
LFGAAYKVYFVKPRRTKKQVSEANGQFSFLARPPQAQGIAAGNPSLRQSNTKPRKGHFYFQERPKLALQSGWNINGRRAAPALHLIEAPI